MAQAGLEKLGVKGQNAREGGFPSGRWSEEIQWNGGPWAGKRPWEERWRWRGGGGGVAVERKTAGLGIFELFYIGEISVTMQMKMMLF